MDQSRQQSNMAYQAVDSSGLSSEVGAKVLISHLHELIEAQFMAMLEPSFALAKRYAQDQHRSDTENELKLQNQLPQFWQRIKALESGAQRVEADKVMLESRVQSLEDDKVSREKRAREDEQEKKSLEVRLQETENDKAALEHRLQEVEKAIESRTPVLGLGARSNSVAPNDEYSEPTIELT